jgi:hypothetical protein
MHGQGTRVSHELSRELPEVLLCGLHLCRGTRLLIGGRVFSLSGNGENRLVVQESRALQK